MITEEQLTSNIKNTSYENSHPNEIAQTILNREKDRIEQIQKMYMKELKNLIRKKIING